MQRIRPALVQLQKEIGVEHALASRKLYTDGAELLFDYGERQPDTVEGRSARDLVVVRNGQRVFVDVIERVPPAHPVRSRRVRRADPTFPPTGTPRSSPTPRGAFGAPIFERGGARVDDVLERFWAGRVDRRAGRGVRRPRRPARGRPACRIPTGCLTSSSIGASGGSRSLACSASAGLRLVTLAEHYGVPADETIADEEWLELAGEQRLGGVHEGHPDPLQPGRAGGGQASTRSSASACRARTCPRTTWPTGSSTTSTPSPTPAPSRARSSTPSTPTGSSNSPSATTDANGGRDGGGSSPAVKRGTPAFCAGTPGGRGDVPMRQPVARCTARWRSRPDQSTHS